MVRFAVPPVSIPGPALHSTPVSVVAIIPARYESSRFPGKPLADIGGRTMIEHVYRRTSAARSVGVVIVATDDERICDAVEAFGGRAQLTSPKHLSGTDRLAEIAATLTCDVVVNVQGDEPLIEPSMIDDAIAPFRTDRELQMTTPRRRIEDRGELENPNVTKVVVDREGYALYFSRAPIPFTREGCPPAPAWRHIGLYAYRRECLMRITSLPATAMEQAEALEQLRALEHGIRIKTIETVHDSVGVDTPEDLARVRQLVQRPLAQYL